MFVETDFRVCGPLIAADALFFEDHGLACHPPYTVSMSHESLRQCLATAKWFSLDALVSKDTELFMDIAVSTIAHKTDSQ